MKRYALVAFLLLACAVGLLLYHQPARVVGSAEAGKQKWEYKYIHFTDVGKLDGGVTDKNISAGLNKLGDEGWELAAVASDRDGQANYYVFKRAK